jgi:hypothetical protein
MLCLLHHNEHQDIYRGMVFIWLPSMWVSFFVSLQDGTYSTLKGSCTVVRDFTDFIFHSYFDSIDEFRTGEPKGGKPLDIK